MDCIVHRVAKSQTRLSNFHCKKCYGGGLVAKSCPTIVFPWTVACQAPLSIGFSRQEYWSRLTFVSPRVEPGYPTLLANSLLTELPGKPQNCCGYFESDCINSVDYLGV